MLTEESVVEKATTTSKVKEYVMLLKLRLSALVVLSYNEIIPEAKVKSLGVVSSDL